MNTLDVQAISKRFGGVAAVDDVSFTIDPGRVHAVIGPNGAGKTTLFNLITGIYAPSHGEIRLRGALLNSMPPHLRVREGISRTFQNLQVCMNMTARENVMLGAHLRLPHGLSSSIFRAPALRRAEQIARDEAQDLLDFVGVAAYAERNADELPYGVLKRLEIARALAARPAFLFLDEPAAGLNQSETRRIRDLIKSIQQRGTTVVLVEHDMKLVMSVAEHVIVLNHGRKLFEGTPAQVRAEPCVIEAYLGSEVH